MNDLIDAMEDVSSLLSSITSSARFKLVWQIDVAQPNHRLRVTFTGPDVFLLTRNSRELLRALEHFVQESLGTHDPHPVCVSFDATLPETDPLDERWQSPAELARSRWEENLLPSPRPTVAPALNLVWNHSGR